MMTVDDVRKRFREIEEITHDDEMAHSLEDSLWHDVLRAIAAGHPDPIGLASAALATEILDFARWSA